MKKEAIIFLFGMFFVFGFSVVSAVTINDDLHLNIQLTDSNDNIQTGTFDFVFNISNADNCNAGNIVYTNSTSLTTDSRGVVSYYLPDVTLEYNQQYWLCYYKSGSLEERVKLAKTPYTFEAQNISASGVRNDSNLDLTNKNVTASYGFLSFLGNAGNRIGKIFASNLDVSGDSVFANATFNGGWENNGVSILEGDIYAQTGFFYDIIGLNISNLNVNGSIIPNSGFDNIFDIGNSTNRWRDLFIGGTANITGQLIVGGENITGDSNVSQLYGYNESEGQFRPVSINEGGALKISVSEQTSVSGWDNKGINVTLTNSGDNVGIGISPSQKLDVSGAIQIGNTGSAEAGVLRWTGAEFQAYNGTDWNSFGASGGTGSLWGQSGSDVYYNSGSVGINTTTPTNTLNVVGDINSTGNLSVDTNTLFVDSNNNRVGIGTTSPGALLTVAGTGSNNGEIIVDGRQGSGSAVTRYNRDTTANRAFLEFQTAGASDWFIGTPDTDNVGTGDEFYISSTDSSGVGADFWIESNGNVGIGTTSPLEELNIESITPVMMLTDSDATSGEQNWAIQNVGGTLRLRAVNDANSAGNNAMTISRSGTSILSTLFPNGVVGVGGQSGDGKLEVSQGSESRAMQVNLVDNGIGIGMFVPTTTADSSDDYIQFGDNSATRGWIEGNGGGVTYGSASDRRLKENIASLEKTTLEKVLSLNPVRYTAINGTETQIGFIAQEVDPLFPELALEPDKDNEYWGLDYARFTPLNTKAIQELKAEKDSEIEKLNSSLNEKESEIQMLKSELCSKDSSYSWC